jgi:GTPase SAR1 family protein
LIPKKSIEIIFNFFREKFGEAAEILYEILNNLTVLSQKTPIILTCNKQDLQFAKKAPLLESELEREIEEIRKVRRAHLVDDDKAKQRYLETMKKRFTFAEMAATGIVVKFVECSVKTEEMSEVY